jgi:hypothetical protein
VRCLDAGDDGLDWIVLDGWVDDRLVVVHLLESAADRLVQAGKAAHGGGSWPAEG